VRSRLLAPGVRTATGRDWRTAAGTAVAAVVGDPATWLLALLGFAARGGTLVLALPILSVPSPVLLSMLFRGDLGGLGRDDVRLVSTAIGLAISLLAIGGVILSAYADVSLADRVVHDPETEDLRLGRVPRRLDPPAHRSLVWWVASVQAVALLPIVAVLTLLVDRVVDAITDELVVPSSTDLPLVLRALPPVAGPALLAALTIVIVSALSSLATRRLMASAWGLLPQGPVRASEWRLAVGALRRLVVAPGRVIATALAGWLILGAAMLVAGGASAVAWEGARDVMVGGTAPGPGALAVSVIILGLFSAVWLGGLALVGCAAAIRSTLWLVDALR
jgi:hypothetical protein